jgi:steroid 5-alpha reductase family enzyme
MNNSVNETSPVIENMGQQGKSWVYFLIIAVCVVITQVVAYFATPQKTIEDRKYILNILAAYTILVQWVVFLHAGGFFGNERTEKYYDLTGSLTFLSTLALSLYLTNGRINVRQIVLSAFVAFWSARLGWFLFTRIHNNNGIDSRFTILKQSRPRFLMAWTMQGMWVFLTMLPVLMLNQTSEDVDFGVFDYIGIPMWAIGFIFEVISDYQKSAFRKIIENKERFISTGLWSISRHPNYFGEILLWIGLSLSAFGGLSARPKASFVFLSPVFVALLLIFVSGIPLLEQKADKKYGDSDDYQRYKKETPVLVPFIGRGGDTMF